MRHGRRCAVGLSAVGLWALGLSGAACSPGGSGKSTSVVTTNQFGNPSQPAVGRGGADQGPQTSDQGDLFGGDSELGCTNGCAFTATPLLDDGVSAADIAPFAASTDFKSGSLCVVEPQLSRDGQPGALFPRNWLRPRFRWTSTGGETLWEIRMHSEGQPEDLRAYTRSVPGKPDTQWIVPKDVWKKMRDFTKPVTVTVRGLGAGGVFNGSSGDFEIAPVDASGSLVFWATTSSVVDYTQASSKLEGFSLADIAKNTETDEGVAETLSAPQVQTNNIPGESGDQPRGYYACRPNNATLPTCPANPPANLACCSPSGFQYGQVECVGCHVSTPDGKAVLFTDNWPWDKVAASIEPATVGALPATITAYASELLKQPWLGMQALSPAVFSDQQRILVTTYGQRPNPGTLPFDATPPTRHEIAWFDLMADDTATNPIPAVIPPDPPLAGQTQNIYQVRDARNLAVGRERNVSWGLIATIGETRSAVTPAWSNDGQTIAYVSTDVSSTDGHPDWTANEADIHVVPYNGHGGGNMQPLQGASDPSVLEYYPDFSGDDAFIAFVRAPKPTQGSRCIPTLNTDGTVKACPAADLGANPDGPYYNRNGEIYIVPRAGAAAPTRLIANDPVSCTGETVQGSINSWPKWSPRVAQQNGKSYYFLMFSSARSYPESFRLAPARLTPAILNKSAQLYMAAIVVDDATQAITTYPAVYLWNQNIVVNAQGEATIVPTSNLTPAWDDFSIPPVPPILKPPR